MNKEPLHLNRGKLRNRELMLFGMSPRFLEDEAPPSGRAEERHLGEGRGVQAHHSNGSGGRWSLSSRLASVSVTKPSSIHY